MKLDTMQQAEVAKMWRDCQRIAAAECQSRGIYGDLRRDIVNKAILQTIAAVARNQLTGDAILSRARSCAIDCIRTAAMSRDRNTPLTILVSDESGFPAELGDPLTTIDLPVLSDQQIETFNSNWAHQFPGVCRCGSICHRSRNPLRVHVGGNAGQCKQDRCH